MGEAAPLDGRLNCSTKVDSYSYQDVVWHAILNLYILWYYFLDNQTQVDNTRLIEMSMIINMHV